MMCPLGCCMVSSWTHNFIAPHTSPWSKTQITVFEVCWKDPNCDLRLGQFFDIFSFHCLFINVDNSRDTWNGDGNKKGAFNKFFNLLHKYVLQRLHKLYSFSSYFMSILVLFAACIISISVFYLSLYNLYFICDLQTCHPWVILVHIIQNLVIYFLVCFKYDILCNNMHALTRFWPPKNN